MLNNFTQLEEGTNPEALPQRRGVEVGARATPTGAGGTDPSTQSARPAPDPTAAVPTRSRSAKKDFSHPALLQVLALCSATSPRSHISQAKDVQTQTLNPERR